MADYIDNGSIRLRFLRTAKDTSGELLEMEATYRPTSSPPPAHYHPSQEETFEVLSGSLRFVIEGEERIVNAGERLVIPAGTIHEASNPNAEEAVVIWQTRPALRTQEFFEALYGLSRNGGTKPDGSPKLLPAAVIMQEYSDVFVLARPSKAIQKLAFGILSPIAKAVAGSR